MHEKKQNFLLYFHRTCRTRTLPYFDKIFKTKYSNTIRQKFKVNIFSDRVKLALSESYFIFIFWRLVFDNFYKENWFKYGTDTVRRQIRWKYSRKISMHFAWNWHQPFYFPFHQPFSKNDLIKKKYWDAKFPV